MAIAIIPVRGGSKGIPGKNLLPILGKPLVVHSIEQARSVARIDEVLVSTDSEAIANVARMAGATIVVRPAELATDTAPSESALLHALDDFKTRRGSDPDAVVFLQATSPIRQPGEIDAALETMEREHADSLLSVCRLNGFVWKRHTSKLEPTYDHLHRPRRKSLRWKFRLMLRNL